MPEPTIDELLACIDRLLAEPPPPDTANLYAIRAILEQHRRDWIHLSTARLRLEELEAIRAFVGRVEKRVRYPEEYEEALKDELAAMEKAEKETQ